MQEFLVEEYIFIWRNFKTDVGINVIIKNNLEAGERKYGRK